MRKQLFLFCLMSLFFLQAKSFSGGAEGHGGGGDPIVLFRTNASRLIRFLKNIDKQSWDKVSPESYDFIKANQLTLQKQLQKLDLATLAKQNRAHVRTHEEAIEFLMTQALINYPLTSFEKRAIAQDIGFLVLFNESKVRTFGFLKTTKSDSLLGSDSVSSLIPSQEQLTLFEEAREQVIKTLTKDSSEEKPEIINEETWDWLLTHRAEIADDLAKTKFEFLPPWNKRAPVTCGSTVMEPGATIVFNFEICKRSLNKFSEIQKVLIHEATHHLGIEDEETSDNIARAALFLE